MLEYILYYIVVGLFVMSAYFAVSKSIFYTIELPGFIAGVFLWPLVAISLVVELIEKVKK